MKKIYKISLFLALQFLAIKVGYGQVSILGPIVGPPQICSSANQASETYSVSGTSNPTSFTWTAVSSDGTVIFGTPNAAVTSVTFITNSDLATYTLYCIAQNSSGYSVPVHMAVKVFKTPSVTFSGATNICQGGSGGISASSTSSTLFQSSSTTIFWAPAVGLSSTSSPSVIANPPSTTNYTILTSFGPCTSTNYFLVTVTPSPTINGTFFPAAICIGESSVLNISGTAQTYSVNGVLTSGTPSYSPNSNTSYTLTGTGTGSCQTSGAIVNLLVNTCAGINSKSQNESYLKLYPNPNNGSFILRSEEDRNIKLINELGQLIKTFVLKPNSEFTITDLSPGIYFIVSGAEKKKIVVTP